MKLAYLLSSYPMTSTTFIKREIRAIEALGQPVERFSVRHWSGKLVDPDDIAEQGKTRYILTGDKAALLKDVALTALTRPVRLLKLLPLWWRVYRNAGRGLAVAAAYLLEAMAFVRRANASGIDHVHVHFSTNAAAVAMMARRLGGPSYSFTVHGPDEIAPGVPARASFAEKAREAAFVVAITRYCKGRIVEEAPDSADKVKIVLCGIELADFPYDPIPPDSGRMICIGRLCANKGQVHIPAAVAQVVDEFPGLVIDLIGGGEDHDLIAAEIEKYGVQKNVILRGSLPGDDLRKALYASRALLLPSYAEGLPMVIMEVFAAGRPALTTRITGIPELVDDSCGWLFEPGDIDQIADALRAAMRATVDEREAMGREARKRVEDRHDVRQTAEHLLTAFSETVAAR